MEFDPIHHLISIFVTLYTLILLYLPSFFLSIAFSPVLNSTGIILFSLLRLGANYKVQKESEFLDSSNNERLEKESRVLDCKDNHSNLALESSSVESRFLDLVAQNQTHAEFEDKTCLGLESDQTHVDYEPKSGLNVESKQTHVEFDQDMVLESNSMESSQVLEEEEPKMETHVEFEHDKGLESSEVIKGGQKKEMEPMQIDTKMAFLEWNMRAPLEIIYEAYEGEEEEDEDEDNENHEVSRNKQEVGCQKYPSLLMYYPESETDSSSDGDFPMNEKWETHESRVFFKWEDEEEDREELIEISLDHHHHGKKSIEFCHVEEDNLIEIDLFQTRN